MTGTVFLHSGLDVFLEGTPGLRDPSFDRAADAVLGLLALRGAERRSGLPEPTPELARRVLVEDLPRYVCADPEELAVYPAVLVALTQRVREARRLNAKRQARIVAAVEEAVPDFERAMRDPGNLTWPRWYASLLRADGVDPGDPDAVRAWLAALGGAPRPPAGLHRADLMNRSRLANTMLAEALTAAYLRDAEAPPGAGPLLDAENVAHGVEHLAARLVDRWTAAGLAEAFEGPHAHLAPGPDAFPHLVLADMMLDHHLDYYGDSSVPLPPPPVPMTLPPEEVEAGADLLATAVEEMKAETGGLYDADADHLLYVMYERGCLPESVARTAADYEGWTIDLRLEEAPVDVPPDTGHPYVVPSAAELARLTGVDHVTDEERAELEPAARALAGTIDRLAGTGMVFRSGDACCLTPRGVEVVRYLLRAGWVTAPDTDEVLGWDARTVAGAAVRWPAPVAQRVLAAWLRARGRTAEARSGLTSAVTAVGPAGRGLLRLLDEGEDSSG
ncbi:hypothetical protein [Streptomyces tritici]|uniref:hypothetical protein n=1 Tax=Streptomyces tritici TaxID=2054410 RepID=UPI003AEF7AC5